MISYVFNNFVFLTLYYPLNETRFGIKDSVVEGGNPFKKVHGKNLFEYASADARLSKLFNDAMWNHSTIVMTQILQKYHGFNNLERVVDVGGGLGININMIVTKHPTIKGVNFDLPHVIQDAPIYPGMIVLGIKVSIM